MENTTSWKLIIAGSRNVPNSLSPFYEGLEKVLSCSKISEVVCGGARGGDTLGRDWAGLNNIPVTFFIANWNLFGKSAGIKRNIQMGDYADALYAFWDGESKGTKHMIEYMKSRKKPVFVQLFN